MTTAPPHARFRCLVCRVFVRGTEAGHCPRCGFVPPRAPAPPRSPATWSAARVVVGLAGLAVVIAVLVAFAR